MTQQQEKDNVLKQIFRTGQLPPVRYQLVLDNKDVLRIGTAIVVTIVITVILVQLVRKSIK